MQQIVKERAMPKSYRERLDELIIGGCIPIDSDEEKDKFAATMYREFHKTKHSKPVSTKLFTIRTDKITKDRAIWRLK